MPPREYCGQGGLDGYRRHLMYTGRKTWKSESHYILRPMKVIKAKKSS